jgi:hypothetical protein
MREVRLQVFQNRCAVCALEFETLEQTEDYGVVLYRNRAGVMQFLDSATDSVWREVSNLVDVVTSDRAVRQSERARLFHRALARTLDSPPGGAFRSAWETSECPRCGSTTRAFFGPVEPPQFRTVDLDEVSHTRWQHLTKAQKLAEVRDAVDS